MRWLLLLLGVAALLALVGTVTHSAIAGWLGVAALVGSVVAYVHWRRVVRRTRYY